MLINEKMKGSNRSTQAGGGTCVGSWIVNCCHGNYYFTGNTLPRLRVKLQRDPVVPGVMQTVFNGHFIWIFHLMYVFFLFHYKHLNTYKACLAIKRFTDSQEMQI